MRLTSNIIFLGFLGVVIFYWQNIPVALFILAVVVVFADMYGEDHAKAVNKYHSDNINTLNKRVSELEHNRSKQLSDEFREHDEHDSDFSDLL